MQVSTTKQKRSTFAVNPALIVHSSLLGGFVGLVGYIAVVCYHVH